MNTLLKYLLIAATASCLGFAFSARAAQFGLNDVSILLPLPEPQLIESMMKPADVGAKGALLPLEVYKKFPTLDSRFEAQSLYDHNFKVVGIRIDPCFAEGTSTVCRKQIRMVWQPMLQLRDKTSTLDAAVHTFYEFTDAEWTVLMGKWASIAKGNLAESLQVHPSLKQEGYSGATWTKLKKIILDSCGEKNLVRATGMRLTETRMWTFLGFDKTGTTWTQMAVPRTSNSVQTFIIMPNAMFDLNEFTGNVAPAPTGEPLLMDLISNSRNFKSRATEADAQTLMSHAIQFENPKLNNPGTVDCVSCHVAQTVRLWGEKNYARWDWRNAFNRDRFTQADRSLENNSVNPMNANRVRAFGYFDADPMFSQRVINESAVVSKALTTVSARAVR